MMTFHDVSIANFQALQFVAQGDGLSTVFRCNLSKPPFNISFNGNTPAVIAVTVQDPDTAVASAVLSNEADGDYLEITFAPAPPTGETLGVNGTFIYASLV